MATQPLKRRASADAPAGKFVKVSVLLDVAVHSRVAVAASLAGTDKNAFLYRVISEAVRGIVIIDRRAKSPDGVDLASQMVSAKDAAPVEGI